MREILFRGFHPCDGPETIIVDGKTVNGRWVEGDFLTDCNGDTYITACKFIPRIPGFGKRTTLPISYNHPEEWVLRVDVPVFKVLPSTVGQYTGLTDKNGTRIFKGDIVDDGVDFSEEEGYGVVQWDDGAFEVIGNGICGTFHENYWGKDFEVIGTVFDEVATNAQN